MIAPRNIESLERAGKAVVDAAGELASRAFANEALLGRATALTGHAPVRDMINVADGGKITPISPEQFFNRFDVTYAPTLQYSSDLPRVPTHSETARRTPADWLRGISKTAAGMTEDSLRTAFAEKFATKLGYKPQLSYPNPIVAWLYGEDIRLGRKADVYIDQVSSQVGRGLFAGSELRPGQYVTEYSGLVEPHLSEHLGNTYTFGLRSDVGVINALNTGNEGRFINHSARPNVQPVYVDLDGREHVVFIAREKIEPGKQLMYNYGKGYWTGRTPVDLRA